MLRTAWWAVPVLCLLIAFGEVATADTLTISFSELESYAHSESSRAGILHRQLEIVRAERDEALQWANPEIAFDREDVGFAESQLTLGKTFDLPWAYRQDRVGWQSRLMAAEQSHEQSTRRLSAVLKAHYVKLRLLDDQLIQLTELEGFLSDVSKIVESRRSEGHISGVDAELVRMALISLSATRHSSLQSLGETDAEWRALLRIGPSTSIRLATPISIKDVNLTSAQSYLQSADQSPGYRAHKLEADFFRSQAGADRGRFIPNLHLYGGYKEIEPDQTGYVFGVSFGVPLFNRNGAAARQNDLRSEIADRDAEAFRIRTTTRVEALLELINESQRALSANEPEFESATLVSALLQSYKEGWIDLYGLLNAVQIAVGGLTDYRQQLSAHYDNIFELEAITGTTLVEFTAEEE